MNWFWRLQERRAMRREWKYETGRTRDTRDVFLGATLATVAFLLLGAVLMLGRGASEPVDETLAAWWLSTPTPTAGPVAQLRDASFVENPPKVVTVEWADVAPGPRYGFVIPFPTHTPVPRRSQSAVLPQTASGSTTPTSLAADSPAPPDGGQRYVTYDQPATPQPEPTQLAAPEDPTAVPTALPDPQRPAPTSVPTVGPTPTFAPLTISGAPTGTPTAPATPIATSVPPSSQPTPAPPATPAPLPTPSSQPTTPPAPTAAPTIAPTPTPGSSTSGPPTPVPPTPTPSPPIAPTPTPALPAP